MKILRHLSAETPPDEIEPLLAGSFFSSPGFLDLWRTLKGLPVWWMARDGGRILAVLPGVEFGRGIWKRLQSTPNGCYGRLSFDRNVDMKQRKEIARQILNEIAGAGYLKVHINDFYGSFENIKGFRSQPVATRIVDVSDPEFRPASRKLSQQIRRAAKLGVTLTRFDHRRHFEQFQTLVKLSEDRMGIREKYPPEFFYGLARLSDEDARVRWVWCEHDGRPVASSIFVVEGDNLLHWHVHFDSSQARLQATKLTLFDTARSLAEEGVRYLNLGVTPDGAVGVQQFKRKWGGQMYSYPSLFRASLLGRLI